MEQSVACYDEPSALPALGVRTITTPISPPLVYLYDDHIHASRTLFPPSLPPLRLSFPSAPSVFLPAPPLACINSFPTRRPSGISAPFLFPSPPSLATYLPPHSHTHARTYVRSFVRSATPFPPRLHVFLCLFHLFCLFLRNDIREHELVRSESVTLFFLLSFPLSVHLIHSLARSLLVSALLRALLVLLHTRGMRRQEFSLTMDLLC